MTPSLDILTKFSSPKNTYFRNINRIGACRIIANAFLFFFFLLYNNDPRYLKRSTFQNVYMFLKFIPGLSHFVPIHLRWETRKRWLL